MCNLRWRAPEAATGIQQLLNLQVRRSDSGALAAAACRARGDYGLICALTIAL
jgi:hypothetical protein